MYKEKVDSISLYYIVLLLSTQPINSLFNLEKNMFENSTVRESSWLKTSLPSRVFTKHQREL